jgi:hypothetical protein
MNLRCIYCQTPFTLSRNEMLGAIVTMNEKNLNHYDAHCPRCRRANSISRQRLELFVPNWQEAVKQFLAAPPPAPAPKAETPSIAHLKTEPISKSMKEAIEKKPGAAASAKEKKPAAAKASAAKKPAAKKPADSATKAKKPVAAKKPATKKK